jgi:hypothetical protein
MKLYLKLILEKLRFILLLRYQKDMKAELTEELATSDLALIEKMANDASHSISSTTLVEMINAYEQTGRSYIPELPLELALMRLMGKNE